MAKNIYNFEIFTNKKDQLRKIHKRTFIILKFSPTRKIMGLDNFSCDNYSFRCSYTIYA